MNLQAFCSTRQPLFSHLLYLITLFSPILSFHLFSHLSAAPVPPPKKNMISKSHEGAKERVLSFVHAYYDEVEKKGTASCYVHDKIADDLTELGWSSAWDKKLVTKVYLPPWNNMKVTLDKCGKNYSCAVATETDQKKNVDYFLELKDLTLYLRKHGFNRVETQEDEEGRAARRRSSLLKPDVAALSKHDVVALSKHDVVAVATNAAASHKALSRSRKTATNAGAAAGDADHSPGESCSMSTSSDSASDVSLAGEALVMSHVNSYYNAVNAGKPAPFYLYPAIESDLGKLGWMRVWDRKQCGHVVLAPWSGVDVEEKPNPRNNSCDVVQSGRKNNVDYFWDTKDLTLYLQKHGFKRVDTQEDEEGRAARRRSSLLKPDVADATNAQQAPSRSRPSARSVPATNMSVSSPESDVSFEAEVVEEQLSPTAKVTQLIQEYDDYERENKRVPGNLLLLPPPTITPSDNYPSM